MHHLVGLHHHKILSASDIIFKKKEGFDNRISETEEVSRHPHRHSYPSRLSLLPEPRVCFSQVSLTASFTAHGEVSERQMTAPARDVCFFTLFTQKRRSCYPALVPTPTTRSVLVHAFCFVTPIRQGGA